MTDKKDEPGKGPARPGDGPRRPYATLDLQATEVGGKDKGKPAGATGSTKSAPGTSALPPPGANKGDPGRSTFAARLAAARRWPRAAAGSNTFLSHVAAGVAGAVLTLIAAGLAGLLSGGGTGGRQLSPDVHKRLAALEHAIRQRAPGGDTTAKLARAETRLKSLEDQAGTVTALSDAQSKLAANLKVLEARSSSPELVKRLAKMETALAALSAGERGDQAVALSEKLTELEKLVGDAGEASKSGAARSERELAVIKTEANRLTQRLDALKSDIDERFKSTAKSADVAPLAAKLATFETDLKSFLRSEGARTDNSRRVLLTLEIASLKRAMDRGEPYTAELDAVRKLAGTSLDLAPLARYSLEGAPTLPALAKEFRRVANAAIDSEAEPADASVLDRLVAGAKSIVRVRKADHSAGDGSTEAVVGRMDAALKEGRLGDVLEQGRKLQPKAQLAAEDWLKKVEARHAVDRAIAAIEVALKSSLMAQPGSPAEPKR